MFDVETSRLIRRAPALRGVDPEVLPQELTGIYAELVALRLREDELEAAGERAQLLERLSRIATIYEACADATENVESRRAAAFVAATSHQILGKVMSGVYDTTTPYLSASSIHPLLAAPLLFLVAEQNADAREAARALADVRDENLIKSAVIETIYDLASENYQSALDRAARLAQMRAPANEFADIAIEQALYGLCWSGIVQMISRLLAVENPDTQFLGFDTPQQAFETVIELSVEDLALAEGEANSLSVFTGPRHLASLLRHLSDGLEGAGVANIPPPEGAGEPFWGAWLKHRTRSKPVLWSNHQRAIQTGFLDKGRSAVLVLPTGAGKTTLSELKIASTLAAGDKVVFLVPTLALVDQLRDELAESFPVSIGNVEVAADGDLTGALSIPQLRSVEVMTPERCLALMSHNAEAMEDVGLVVFDECHLLSPQGGGTRSLDAMLCLIQAIRRAPNADFLLLSAMLTNAEDFASWIGEITNRPCPAFQDSWKPSRQARGVVVYARDEIAEIRRRAMRAARTQTRVSSRKNDAVPYGLFGLHQNWNAQAAADIRLIKLSDRSVELSISASGRATPNANKVAARLTIDATLAGLKSIVFVQQPGHAVSTARKISEELESTYPLSATETALWDDIRAELGGPEHSFIQPGVAALPHKGLRSLFTGDLRVLASLWPRQHSLRA